MVLPPPKYYEPSFGDDTPESPDTAAGPRQVSIAYYEAEDWEAYKQRPNARLCTSCEAYFSQDWKTLFTGHGTYELHPTYDMLKLSANAGCSFCEMICVAVSAGPSIYNPQQKVKLSTWLKEITASRFDRDTIAPNSELTIYVSVENGLQRVLDFKALLSAIDCDKHYFSLSEDSRIMRLEKTVMHEGLTKLPLPRIALRGASTRQRHSMERARNWYETCVNTHPECCNVSERRLPTRLLSIKNGQVRLILGEDLDISTKYATLSHRWGNAELLQLTRENYQNFLQGIELDDLCKSFRDALDITLEFGLMYLWIDSLCIVQNDEDDWKRESVLMSTVYGCSEITIAATSAHDGTEGCFYERQMPYPRFARVSVDVPDGHGIYDISPVFHEEWKFGDILSFRHGSSPLYRRAWAYQERILSCRVIHYTQYQLLWQCSTSRVEERGFDAITTGNDHPFVGRELFHRRDFWEDMVQEYSACNLTFMTDKLIAISGIATRWQEIFPDEYAAGMWRTGLEVALCWTVDIFRSPPVPARPEVYLGEADCSINRL